MQENFVANCANWYWMWTERYLQNTVMKELGNTMYALFLLKGFAQVKGSMTDPKELLNKPRGWLVRSSGMKADCQNQQHQLLCSYVYTVSPGYFQISQSTGC